MYTGHAIETAAAACQTLDMAECFREYKEVKRVDNPFKMKKTNRQGKTDRNILFMFSKIKCIPLH